MNPVAFTRCENRFTDKCSGEATILVLAAERYGVFKEEARERVEELCAHCRNYRPSEKTVPGMRRKWGFVE